MLVFGINEWQLEVISGGEICRWCLEERPVVLVVLKKGGESKNLELEMGQIDLLLIFLFCFGHKQS